jgi:Zn-dependent M28 family amino/carboxypeptidase
MFSSHKVQFSAMLVISLLSGCEFSGCKKDEQPIPENPTPKVQAIPPAPVPPFDADRAFGDIEKQMAFGPRVPNSSAHDKALAFLKEVLSQCTSEVSLQDFTSPGYKDGETLKLTNVIASFNPQATWRVLILTHYDSRPWADEDPNKANKDKPVPAANDGASGSAVMLELARQFKDNPPPIGVDLLFDDGEDYGKYDVDQLTRYFLGVKYFVKSKSADYNPRFAILLDMVGDKNAIFAPEANSVKSAPQFTNEIWKEAASLGLSHFRPSNGSDIEDDHIPLIEAGIPSVDIIDGQLVGHATDDPERKYWHTIDDLPKHLSPATLGEVGKLLLHLIYDRLPRDIPAL